MTRGNTRRTLNTVKQSIGMARTDVQTICREAFHQRHRRPGRTVVAKLARKRQISAVDTREERLASIKYIFFAYQYGLMPTTPK
jgi:hypothetical protein